MTRTAVHRGTQVEAAGGDPRYILVLGDVGDEVWRQLADLGRGFTCVDFRDADDDLRASAEILFIWDFRSRELETAWPSLTSLRWIHTASAGVDHVLFPRLAASDVVLTNSAGIFSAAIAEYVLGLVLLDAKGLAVTIEAQRERRWSYRETEQVEGKTMVVVGLGDIGRQIARRASAVGMVVIGVKRSLDGAKVEDGIRLHAVRELLSVLPSADYLVVSAALTPETSGLIDERALNALKPAAFLVNVSRGPLVDKHALVAALRAGRLRGAALDTFDTEPLAADDELWEVPHLVVSPHMAGDTHGWQRRAVDLFATNVDQYLQGTRLTNVIDKARGY